MEMANKRYTDAEIDQILRENAQMRRWLAEYQRAAREQRKASEKRYAARKKATKRAGLRETIRRVYEFVDELPVSIVVICSLFTGIFLAASIAMGIAEVSLYETMLWMQGNG